MSHPQPPFGPQDPNQPDPEPPTQAFPTAPMPPVPADPYAPQPPVSGAPQPPVSGAPYPPVSGAPQPPVSGAPYPPAFGAPQPPAPGAAYPPVPGTSYPGGAPMPPGPGYPLGAPQPAAPGSKKKTWVIIGVVVAVLALLCCVGGIFALVAGANEAAKKADEISDSLPTPATTVAPAEPSDDSTSSAPSAKPTGETFNMAAGDTLVITDDDGTFEITVTKFSTSTKPCESFGLKPDEGMFLIADVTVKVTKGKASVNPFFFEWVGTDGTEANGISGAFSGCGKQLQSGVNLPAGTTRKGSVVFDVPNKNGAVEYEHRLEVAGSWKP